MRLDFFNLSPISHQLSNSIRFILFNDYLFFNFRYTKIYYKLFFSENMFKKCWTLGCACVRGILKALEKENKSLKKFVKIVINVFSSGF